MKTLATLLTSAVVTASAPGSLIITGVFDGPLPGGDPKGVELYATTAIADLSAFGLGRLLARADARDRRERPGPGAGASLARDRKPVPATGARGGLVAALGRATQGRVQRRWPRARLAE